MTQKLEFKDEYTEHMFDKKFGNGAVFFNTDELELARESCNRMMGQIYTEVDGDNGGIYYVKGIHFVNRIQYVVIGNNWKEHKLEPTDIGVKIVAENLIEDERYYANFGKSKRIIVKKYSKHDRNTGKSHFEIDIMLCDQKTGKLVKYID